MTKHFPALLLLCFLASAGVLTAASSATFHTGVDALTIATVTAADDARVAALIARDQVRLEAVFSDELHYAHSNGVIDEKTTFIEAIATGRSVYEAYEYQERRFQPVAPGVMLMTGRTRIHSRSGDDPIILDLNFLAVWRHEHGRWQFLAWQSCRQPPPAPP